MEPFKDFEMINKIQDGTTINHNPKDDVLGGSLVILPDMVAVAITDIAKDELGACQVEGVFAFPKAADAINQGTKVYADKDNNVTGIATEGTPVVGVAWADASKDHTEVQVKINV